jgi:ABC-type antimicrobial peptide transport system permease subunit
MVFSVLPIVLRRFAANSRLILAVVIGAILASALMSTTSIYTDAIRELGLKFAVREAGPNVVNPIARSSSQTAEADVYTKNRDAYNELAQERFGPLIKGHTYIGRSATFYPATPGQPYPKEESRPRSHFQFITDLEPHVNVVEGRLPADATYGGSGGPTIEVALSAATARRLNIGVGTRYDDYPFFLDTAPPVHLTIVGLIEPKDLSDPYWRNQTDLFDYASDSWDTLPFFVSENTFFQALGAYLPGMSSDYWNITYLDTSGINARNAESVRASVGGFQNTVTATLLRTDVETGLPNLLATYDQKLFFTRIPLLVLVLQIAAIVLYYLFMVSTMLVERQAPEIALLKSRGATTPQVIQIYIVEGLLIFLVAVGLGPPLAATVISFLGRTPPFENLSEGANLSVRLTGDAYLWAAGGALLAYVTLLWPAYQATRRTVVQQRAVSARPPKQSFFTRYYLDLVLVGLGAILYYQLDRSGKLTTTSVFGDQEIDPVRLLTPAFFILTIGIVFLRLFPLVLRLISVGVSQGQGSAIMVGMWQLVRNPVHYSRLVLLLMLATAVGTFAASFGTTLNRSYDDRAAYQAGSGLRISGIRNAQVDGPTVLASSLAQQVDAVAASPVIRLNGSPVTSGAIATRSDFDVLGVDPATIEQVGRFRSDFADGSMASRLNLLDYDPASENRIDLPADARYIGLWWNPTGLRGRVAIEVKLLDATGRYFSYTLGPEAGIDYAPGWYFGVVDLSAPSRSFAQIQFTPPAPPQGPFKLDSVSVRFGTRVSTVEGAVLLDELQTSATPPAAPFVPGQSIADNARAGRPFSQSQVVLNFDSPEQLQVVQGMTAEPLPDEIRPFTAPSIAASELRWSPAGANPVTHGVRSRGSDDPMPVLASKSFLAATNHAVGDRFSVVINNVYVEIEVKGDFELFPTLEDPRTNPAIITNVTALSDRLNANPRATPIYPDEVWFEPSPTSDTKVHQLQDTQKLNATITSFAALRAAQEKDPLVAAGWEGILFISFAAILLLSAIGFLIYSYLTAQKRTLEFAVLRTMGFSRRQIALVVGFEQVFVIGLGMIAGTLLGLRLGTLMIRYMGVTETGDTVVPPMVLHVSWTTIGSAWLVLGAAFLLTVGIVILLYSRLALHRVLRIGES